MAHKFLLGFAVIFSSHVFAAEVVVGVKAEAAKIEKALDSCLSEAVSNFDMGECSSQKYKSADALLNRVYKARVAALNKEAQAEKGAGPLESFGEETLKRLVKAQKAWIAFRDAECDLAGAEMLHGGGEALLVSGCLAEITLERAVKLGEAFGSVESM